MKQGRASHSGMGATKPTTVSRTVSPAVTADIGVKKGNHVSDGGHTVRGSSRPLYEGRGIEAPSRGTTVHKKGSQGTHK